MSEQALFTTPEVARVFLTCAGCHRIMPHYRAYGSQLEPGVGRCRSCGQTQFRPSRIPEWKAAWWLLVVGWLWRKTIRKYAMWDPRMPVRTA
jgi:hypothetical protein